MQKTLINYQWKDRKRFWGMPITFTRYAMSDDRLFVKKGFLNLSCEEILLYRIRDIGMTLKLTQRIFGVGSIQIHSSDKSTPHLTLVNVRHPEEVKELIHQQVETAKINRRMRLGEILEDHDCDGDDGDDDFDE